MSRSAGTCCSTVSRKRRNSCAPVARHAFADDGSGLYVEGGKQRGRPVPLVVMGVPFDLPGSHREQRLGAIQRLDLRFLIDAEHQRVVWRVEIEADNVAHLV